MVNFDARWTTEIPHRLIKDGRDEEGLIMETLLDK